MGDIPIFPEVWDSTIRSAFVACPRNFFYSHLLHLRKGAGKSIHLHFGGCFAKGLETVRKAYWQYGRNELDAINDGVRALIKMWGDYEIPDFLIGTRAEVKDLSGCIDALVSYFEYHQLGNDPVRPLIVQGEPMVETSFAVPVPGMKHPTTGNPILYAGRFDMVGVHNDAIFVEDDKTALQLGPMWRTSWPMRGQFTGYCWGMKSLLPPELAPIGCIVRGVGIRKQDIVFEQVILSRPDWQIAQWLRQLIFDIDRAISLYEAMCNLYEDEGHLAWDQALDSACSSYGGCSYLQLCDTPDPRNWYDQYNVQPWYPLQREGE